MLENKDINLVKKLDKLSKETTNLLKADNTYKASAWFMYAIMVIVSFFISLGNSEFDFTKILQAQFWIDFSVTFFGGVLLKYAFGKWGDFEGHKHPLVIDAIKEINDDNLKLQKYNLLEKFKEYLEIQNKKRKLRAIKRKTFKKLRKNEKSKKWLKIKKCILLNEELIEATTTKEKNKIKNELNELNFDLDSYKIKYSSLNNNVLQTGISVQTANEDSLTYSELYQLFGKNIFITALLFIITIILAVTTVIMEDITLKTLTIFFTRLLTYSINAYLGFSIGKSGVETIKLNILKSIHRFLSTFIEINTKDVIEVKNK